MKSSPFKKFRCQNGKRTDSAAISGQGAQEKKSADRKYYLFALGNSVVKQEGALWYRRDKEAHCWIDDSSWFGRYFDAQYDVIEIDYDEETETISGRRPIKGYFSVTQGALLRGEDQLKGTGGNKTEGRSVSWPWFADDANIRPDRVQLRKENGSYHSIDTSLNMNPLWHEYRLETYETIVRNSHGTDVDDIYKEEHLDSAAAIGLLQDNGYRNISDIKRYEESSCQANLKCIELLKKVFPFCIPGKALYNSGNSTVIQASCEGGVEKAFKICRYQSQDIDHLRMFQNVMEAAETHEGMKFIVSFEEPYVLQNTEDNPRLAVIEMPCLQPAYRIAVRKGGETYYKCGQSDSTITPVKAGRDIAMALSAIHLLGFVHHDVRPENFLLDENGGVQLGDLSSIRPLANQYFGHMQGSTLFRAPELERKEPYGYNIDTYAWGLSFLYILTYCPPFQMNAANVAFIEYGNGDIALQCGNKISERLRSDEERTFAKCIMRAISKDPQQRFRDGTELCEALHSGSA